MKLDREQGTGHVIRSFADGCLVIGGDSFTSPVIVTAEQLISDWVAPPVPALTTDDLHRVLALEPEVIVLGTGMRQIFPPQILSTAILRRGIGLEIMATAAACRTYNILTAEFRRVAAILYPG